MTAPNPYAEAPIAGSRGALARLNPLSKIGAVLPAMLFLVFSRDIATPLVLLVASLAILFAGTRMPGRLAAGILGGTLGAILVLSFSFSLWVDAEEVDRSTPLLQLGGLTLYLGAVQVGLATALRLTAILALSLPAGLTSTGPDLARAMVQQLRVPYRVGYTALAAFRFVPRFAHDLEVIRAAHRVRGMAGGRGPVAALRRYGGYVVPLLAGGIRHAERVALAMDARAFGAHATRTERHRMPFGARDWIFMALCWAATAVAAAGVPLIQR